MPVYVDPARYPFKGHIMCHMTADSLSELHDMAGRIGMRREWFQIPPKASFPHYDIPLPRRSLAVNLGAIEVNERTTLYFAAQLGLEWVGTKGDSELIERYKTALVRASKHVPMSLVSGSF